MKTLKVLSEEMKGKLLQMSVVEAYQAGFEAGKSSTSASVEVAQETVEHEGLVLCKVNRKVSPDVYVRFHNTKCNSRLKDGVIYGPVKRTMTIGNNNYNVFNKHHNRTPDNVEVFEVVGYVDMLPEPEIPLTANQQRAELIKRAREFVEKEFEKHQRTIFLAGKNEVLYGNKFAKVDFVVNEEKRTIVALVKEFNTKNILSKGIAKCMPGEVFNADIGKAIALARALEIDIPQEFLQAAQPTEPVSGMKVYGNEEDPDEYYNVNKVFTLTTKLLNDSFHYEGCFDDGAGDWIRLDQIGDIIDDTNAQYEEAS
ncbi:hypothetical protein ACFQ38_02340 [Sporosarcina contaminans]|uniref:Uncharacterized protein n=1 Tax=Sporosarcina contaminans TaxID=633403 RepID=A0ABW3TTY7_9BACL